MLEILFGLIGLLVLWIGYLLSKLKRVPLQRPLDESVPVRDIAGVRCCGHCKITLPAHAIKTHDGFWRCTACKIKLSKEQ